MNTLPLWLDVLVSALLVGGAAFALIGAYGLAKLSDFLKRLHGPTKASTLGVGGVLLASLLVTVHAGNWPKELLITFFVVLTAPISAHLLIQAAIKTDPSAKPPPSE
jgi:multicomponent K+:H+ antiporter subunit G